MLYCIIGQDKKNSLQDRLSVREEHLKRLQALQDEGRLVLAGPFPAIESENPGENGFTGSLIVAEFSDLNEAQTWANADPYSEKGIFTNVTIKPFKKVFP
jgi:uncharacterized protein YciI